MPRGVYVRSAQARANMSAAAKMRAKQAPAAPPPKGTVNRTVKTRAPQAPIVGYGREGHAFRNKTKYNQSMEGQRHAKDPNLKTAPVRGPGGKIIRGKKGNVFFNPAKAAAAQAKARASHPTTASTGPHRVKVPVVKVAKGGGSGRMPKGKK